MRILILTPMYPPDQAGIALQSDMLAEGLRAEGHAAHVLTFSPRDTDAAQDADPEVTRIDRGLRLRKLSLRLWWVMRGLTRDVDLVHVHGYTNLNVHAWLARRGMPVLFTYHGTEVWHHDPQRGGGLFLWLSRRARLACVSQPLADALRDKSGIDSAVVEPAISDPYIAAARGHTTEDKHERPTVLSVKGLYPVNQHETLLRAMATVRERVPNAQLLLAGEGPLRPELEALAGRLGIGDSVRFLGLLDNAELVGVYARAWVFVNTAALDSYGNVTVEALACGTPAVACETAGAAALGQEFPQDIQLVPQGDAAALAEAIEAHLAAARPVTGEARSAIAATKSPAAMTRSYLALYERIMS